MATRSTRLILKNSDIVNRPLPSSLLAGEPIVNTAEGIVFFSGITTSTQEWTPAGTGNTANFFEVGSNLYDLKLRNQIIGYQGVSGSGLVGKFLSGTTNGFVLADISDIYNPSTDTYVTGNTLTAANNETATQSAQLEYNGVAVGGPYFIVTENTFTTGGTYDNSTKLITFVKNDSSNYTVDLSNIDTNDTYVTGGTNNTSTDNTSIASIDLLYNQDILPGTYSLPYTDVYTTGGTYDNNTALMKFDRNNGTFYSVDLSSLDLNDTFVTGFTYNPSSNTFTISRNQGEPDLTASINSVSGLTITNLTAGRVVYVGPSGLLTDESGFEYNDGLNLMTVGNINVTNASGTTANIGQGGLVIGSGGSLATPGVGDLTVHGNFTVFGTETIVATNELYVEDPQITLNYSPTGDTSITSVSSGIKIQDGDGTSTGDTFFTIGQMQNLTGIVVGENPNVSEYTGLTGYPNRGWVTQLNDVVIRNNNFNEGSPNGVRVLAEFDILDGGQY